ncbi:class I SAM-dependent methyltransferase [bacterium]|nr:class I SAM-dependent methyltransferase [bacterium]
MTGKTIDQAFNASIDYYDDWMRKALPNYTDIYSTAMELIPFTASQPVDVLDLGAGTGLFSMHVFEKLPGARFTLIDLADQMLDLAGKRFHGYPDQFEFIHGDYRKLPGEMKYDLVISSLSIHHLTHEEKQDLFHSVYRLLRGGGRFINIDQIRGQTEGLADLYWSHWWKQVNDAEQDQKRIQESLDRRKNYDIDATLAEQLEWLNNAGFTDVDCVYKNFFVGVFLAVKSSAG